MGEVTEISWADGTFNPWKLCNMALLHDPDSGKEVLSEACRFCYAKEFGKRFGGEWGPNTPRPRTSADYWKQPKRWNAQAQKRGVPMNVFCGSLMDIGEIRQDLDPIRADLFRLIEDTPWINWLLLTKRIDTFLTAVPETWRIWFPYNVWMGTTVENQLAAKQRLPHLRRIPCATRFVSMEPLLEQVDISEDLYWLSWVIVGGESGANARPMPSAWVRSLRDQCQEQRTPFHFKQWGEWVPSSDITSSPLKFETRIVESELMLRVGKRWAGHRLDGQVWREMPRTYHDHA